MNKLERLNRAVQLLKDRRIITSQADIAEKLGYKRIQSISDILLGKVSLTPKFIKGLCRSYGLNEKYIEDGSYPIFETEAQEYIVNEEGAPYKASGSPITRAARAFTDIMEIVTTPISALKKKDKALEQKQDKLAREIAELQQKVMQLQQEKDAAEKKGKKA